MRKALIFSVMVGVCAWTVVAMGNEGVVPKGSMVGGKTTTAWTADWQIWFNSFPGDVPNPFGEGAMLDPTVNQPAGPVFFLGGTTGGTAVRSFEVPAGKYLVVPLLTLELSQQEKGFDKTLAELFAENKALIDTVYALHATVNGADVPNLFDYREITEVPAFNFVEKNVGGVTPGPSGLSVSDGYFLVLSPLAPGTHTLKFGGEADLTAFGWGIFKVSIEETITVVPEPWALGVVGVAGMVLGLRRRR